MRTSHQHVQLAQFALRNGFTLSVFDGEEWQVKDSAKLLDIIAAVSSVEESQIKISKDGETVAVALIIPDLENGEDIVNHSGGCFMEFFDRFISQP